MSEVTITKERVDQFIAFSEPKTVADYGLSFKASEIRAIAELAKECLARRAADEGAVTARVAELEAYQIGRSE